MISQQTSADDIQADRDRRRKYDSQTMLVGNYSTHASSSPSSSSLLTFFYFQSIFVCSVSLFSIECGAIEGKD